MLIVYSLFSSALSLKSKPAFFHISSLEAKNNYDVGSRELLVMVLAARVEALVVRGWNTFLVVICTNHKNLADHRSVKGLNSRQAVWSVFLSLFNLSTSIGTLNQALASSWYQPDLLLPSMVKATKEFVSACSDYVQGKALHHPPAGLLHSLPIPGLS